MAKTVTMDIFEKIKELIMCGKPVLVGPWGVKANNPGHVPGCRIECLGDSIEVECNCGEVFVVSVVIRKDIDCPKCGYGILVTSVGDE